VTRSLGAFGVWARSDRTSAELAVELEALGYGALWVGGSPPADLSVPEGLLDATTELVVATGIVNIWTAPADEVAQSYHRIAGRYPGRFLLGIGVGHPESIRDRYQRPYEALVAYLDVLDGAGVPRDGLALAALGPKVLQLAADRTAGAHPYLTTPEHTRTARGLVGAGPLLAPEQHVVLDTDADAARALARTSVAGYLQLRNYRNNWLRLGFNDADMADGGSDALVDALVAHGDAGTVAARLREHLDLGADHVCLQLLVEPGADPLPGYRQLAQVLLP
jgi:probable F420-dependent oxidoreductase